jgi:LysR family nitrogen assimilation transcriptional regulator
MAVDHRQLRYFVEVATLGSINKAAARLHIAQPALSRRMHQLEHELRVKLFNRTAQGVSLTPVGRRLLGRAAALADEFQSLRDFVHDETAPSDQVQIGMVPGASLILLNPVLAQFHRAHPEIMLQVLEGTTPSLRDMVLNRTLEVALVTEPSHDERLVIQPVWTETVYIVGPPGYERRRKQMLALPFILPTPNPTIQAAMAEALDRFGARMRFDIEVEAAATVKRLIEEGNAYSILPYTTIFGDVEHNRFTLFRVPNLRVQRVLIWRAGLDWSPAVAALMAVLRDVTEGILASGRMPDIAPVPDQPDWGRPTVER